MNREYGKSNYTPLRLQSYGGRSHRWFYDVAVAVDNDCGDLFFKFWVSSFSCTFLFAMPSRAAAFRDFPFWLRLLPYSQVFNCSAWESWANTWEEIYTRTMNKPAYTIRELTSDRHAD